jgi:hypothetical protein
MNLLAKHQRPTASSTSLSSSSSKPAEPPARHPRDDGQPSNQWRDAAIDSAQIRPGTKNWAWELKIVTPAGKTLRVVLRVVPAFADASEGARRRLARKYLL